LKPPEPGSSYRVTIVLISGLDFAISEFRDMKMQPSLERALRHKEILGT
jgi:hypothetical protein